MGLFLKRTGLCGVIISYHVFVGFYCLIRINLTGEVCCPVYWGLWLWFEPCRPQNRNRPTAITAYLHLRHIGLLHEWCSQCYESIALEKKGKVICQKIMIPGRSNDLFKHYWASDILRAHYFMRTNWMSRSMMILPILCDTADRNWYSRWHEADWAVQNKSVI